MTVMVILMSYSCRYYFVVEEDNTPLSVTVTPCDAPLEWKLTLQELPEEASGEGSGIIPIRPPVEEVNDTLRGLTAVPLRALQPRSDARSAVLVGFN